MTVFLLIPPHPDPRKRRMLTRRVAGRMLRFARVRVCRVQVAPVALLESLRMARIVTDTGETWVPFDRLASDRSRFLDRWTALSGAAPASGVTETPAANGRRSIDTDRSPVDRSAGPTGQPVHRSEPTTDPKR